MKQGQIVNKLLTAILIISPMLSFSKERLKDQLTDTTTNPLNVQVNVDEQHTAHAVIPVTGGKLSVQGADGTRYTLNFPDGALLKDEDITLTPVSNIEGMPFSGGLVGGLQMAPEGLRLFHPATLSIESPKTVAAQGFVTVAFAYHQNGEGVYLNPSETKGNVLILEIWHFSGEASVQATPAEIQNQQQRIPSNPEDAFIQRMQEYLGRERQAQLLGKDPDPAFEKMMGDFLHEAYTSFIAPQLSTALNNCDAAPAILSRALGWLRQVQLLGFDKEFQPESTKITKTMEQALVNCYNKEYDQCVIDNEIRHRVKMLGILRQASLLGIEDRFDHSKILKCPKIRYKVYNPAEDPNFFESGVICDLEKPFTIQLHGDGEISTFKFTPSTTENGSFSMETPAPGYTLGTYIIKANNLWNMPEIRLKGRTCIDNVCIDFFFWFLIKPLNTNDCDLK